MFLLHKKKRINFYSGWRPSSLVDTLCALEGPLFGRKHLFVVGISLSGRRSSVRMDTYSLKIWDPDSQMSLRPDVRHNLNVQNTVSKVQIKDNRRPGRKSRDKNGDRRPCHQSRDRSRD